MTKKVNLDIRDKDNARRFEFLVFQPGNSTERVSVTVMGEDQENGMPAIAHATARIKDMLCTYEPVNIGQGKTKTVRRDAHVQMVRALDPVKQEVAYE